MKQIVDIIVGCVVMCLVLTCCKSENETQPLEPEITLETSAETVESIGKNAFAYCDLSELHMKAIVPPVLGKDVFAEVEALTVYVPSLSVSQYKAAEGWRDLNIVGE